MSDLAASILDGKVQGAGAASNEESKTKKANGSLDKNAFLQLLVAQMKYQDPMEPTSNTEYVSQYATFSQLEEMQNMTNAMNMQRASSLVGKYVSMNVTNEATGATSTVSGRVDYVETSNGKTFLYINDTPYNIDDLDTVWDSEYLDAYNLAGAWSTSVTSLPSTDTLTLNYADSIGKLRTAYDEMSNYQKSFISDKLLDVLRAAEAKIAELKKIAEADANTENTETEDVAEDAGDAETI